MPGTCHEFYFTNFKVIPKVIRGVPVLMGAELNILDFDGNIDLSEYYLKKIDYAVASLHTPCIDNNGSVADYTRAYLNVMENPYVNIIGHPDDSRPVSYTHLDVYKRQDLIYLVLILIFIIKLQIIGKILGDLRMLQVLPYYIPVRFLPQ